MAPRKKKEPVEKNRPSASDLHVMGLRSDILEQPITDTLKVNYMPYAMSVIISRAIPEIDGFKPSHRKLLYTMYQMKLLGGARTKSANIVGQTMKLNPHGDAAIYDTMVRLSKGYGALLHPFVDSKGNFGKVFSRDMAWAASRYTEARLDSVCAELFRDIDQDTVDFQDNYDGKMKEPTLLPTTFPMKEFWTTIQFVFAAIGGWLGYFLGGCDGLLYALLAFTVVDYITGVMCAIVDKNLSSSVGFKGICRKVLIFTLVGIANILDVQVIGSGSVLRTAVIFFYLSNEGVSLLENAAHLGLPIPEKLKDVLEQLHDRAENTESEDK